jgi:hypothetical protein
MCLIHVFDSLTGIEGKAEFGKAIDILSACNCADG